MVGSGVVDCFGGGAAVLWFTVLWFAVCTSGMWVWVSSGSLGFGLGWVCFDVCVVWPV